MISRTLRHFLATFERKNVTAAADDLNITQPALTRSLKMLEEELGVQLFDRLPNGLVPTPYGELLYRYAKRIHQDYRHALLEIDAMRGGNAGQVRIGAGPVWISHFLPIAVSRFNKRYPAVRFSIVQGTITTMLPALLAGEIDFFCGSLDFPDHPQVESVRLLPIRHVIVAGKSHPLGGREGVTADDLAAFPWTSLAHDVVGRGQISAFFGAEGVDPPRIMLETPSVACAVAAMVHGEFIACLAEPLLDSILGRDLVPLAVARPIWDYSAGIARRSPIRTSLAIDRFVAELQAMFEQ
ncbi:LysR family transcriptional regulator [Sphingobium sp.]|uniref:LysR family transcriptional regulator n=1 Tax=Sphingobium sp. TaxID=1912891 RepID=UPI0028BE82DE|nr:LysR family transcriptional regulator [Sphingobium sp.]